jgi:hypothetical protein
MPGLDVTPIALGGHSMTNRNRLWLLRMAWIPSPALAGGQVRLVDSGTALLANPDVARLYLGGHAIPMATDRRR